MAIPVSLRDAAPSARGAGLLDLTGVGLVVRRQWLAVLAAACLAALVLTLVYWLFPFSYKATASVMLDPRPQTVAPGENVLPGFGADPAAVESQAQYMLSTEFMWDVIVRNRLETDADFTRTVRVEPTDNRWKDSLVAALEKRITVARKGLTYIIEVTAKDKDAERAAFFANAVADTYVALQQETRKAGIEEARQWISERLFVLNRKVNAADTALAAFKREQNIVDAGEGHTARERLVTDLTQQLSAAQAEAAAAQARLMALRKSASSDKALQNDDFQSATLTDLRSQYASLLRQHAEVAAVFGERHPRYTAAKLQIRSLSLQIDAELERLAGRQQNALKESREKVGLLEKRLAAVQSNTPDFVRLTQLEDDARVSRKQLEHYEERQNELEQREDLKMNDVSVLSRALPPEMTAQPKRPFAWGAIGFLAALCGLGFGLVREGWRSQAVCSAAQLEAAGLDVLTVLPALDNTQPDQAYEQAIRRLLPSLRRLQTVLVTPEHADVRADLFAQVLATHIAATGQRVIRIRLNNAGQSNAADGSGIGDMLYKGVALESITRFEADGTYTLALGYLPDTAHYERLLMDLRLYNLLDRLRDRYDRIVIEAPEPLTLLGGSNLTDTADGIVMMVRWGASKVDAVQQVARMLERGAGHPLSGVVVDGADRQKLALYDPEAVRGWSKLRGSLS